jgi:hypothetical protein
MKFHENAPCESPFVPFGWADGRTNKTEITVATGRFANASKTQLLTKGATGLFKTNDTHNCLKGIIS